MEIKKKPVDTLDDKKEEIELVPQVETIEPNKEDIQRLQKLMDEVTTEETLKEEVSIEQQNKTLEDALIKAHSPETEAKVISNTDLYEKMMKISDSLFELKKENGDTLLDMKKSDLKMDNHILRKIEANTCIAKRIDEKYNKVTFGLFALFFLIGIVFGTQIDVWSPYIGQTLDFIKTTIQWSR